MHSNNPIKVSWRNYDLSHLKTNSAIGSSFIIFNIKNKQGVKKLNESLPLHLLWLMPMFGALQ